MGFVFLLPIKKADTFSVLEQIADGDFKNQN